jgi:hypothetical protein
MAVFYAFICGLLMQFAHSGDVPYASVEAAFANGDAAKVVNYASDKLYLKVPDKEGVYAKSQATQILKDFFAKKPATSFKFSFKGSTADGANATGTYVSKAESFRVTIKWTKNGSEYEIENISIIKA